MEPSNRVASRGNTLRSQHFTSQTCYDHYRLNQVLDWLWDWFVARKNPSPQNRL